MGLPGDRIGGPHRPLRYMLESIIRFLEVALQFIQGLIAVIALASIVCALAVGYMVAGLAGILVAALGCGLFMAASNSLASILSLGKETPRRDLGR